MDKKPIPYYKNIGNIPNGWKLKPFGEIFEFLNTIPLTRDNLTDQPTKSDIRCIHYGDIHATFTSEILDLSKTYNLPAVKGEIVLSSNVDFLKDGDLIIADASEDYNGVGECVEIMNIGKKRVIAGLHTIVARDKSGDTSEGFRTYLFRHPKVSKWIKALASGSSVYGISENNISKISIPLPLKTEQKKIADILSLLDKAINVTQKAIESNKYRRKTLAKNLLLGKIRIPGFQKQSGFTVSDLGLKVPKDWPLKTIDTIFEERNERSNDQNDYPLFSLTIENGITEKTERYERSFLLKDKDNNQYKIVCPNDILFNPMNLRFGAIAKSNLDFAVSVSAYYNAIKLKDNSNNAIYFENLFKTNVFINLYDKIAIGSLIEKKRVHLSNFFKLQIPFPSPREQDAISKILLALDAEIQLLKKRNNLLMIQKKLLMQQLLTGKKRVKVN